MNASQKLKERFKKSFSIAYDKLNEEQRSAVDAIDGPVMVIAGPGTGKTQILAVRIGRILRETDTQPHNILCLTYTEAATVAMRKRLVDIIGPDGHRVNIHTFHGFCNQVIQEHLGYFGNYRQLEAITDLEKIGLFEGLLNDLPNDHLLKRLKVQTNYEAKRLESLFSLMKKENYTVEDVVNAADNHLEDLRNDESMIYKRSGKGYTKGEFKQKAFDDVERRMNELKAGAALYPNYKVAMLKMNRYDYDDMVTWVIKAFEEDGDMLAEYQERYHYFLVDEFQDTNGSQKRILDLLVSFWGDSPNVFVVGDDDQAIYKFQGANLGNITDFRSQYNPTPVVLKQNYRSSQLILDAAMGLIDFNEERIVKREDFHLEKDLIAQGEHKDYTREVVIRSYANLSHEQAHIAHQLSQWHAQGEDLGKIAILYRNHRQIEKLVEVLEKKGIPLNIRKKVNILKMPLIRNVLTILRYVNDTYLTKGYTDRMLFELMHYNFFEIKSSDISKLVWHNRSRSSTDKDGVKEDSSLISLLVDLEQYTELELQSRSEIIALREHLDKWVADVNDVTLQVLFQNIINEGGILTYVLRHPDKTWLLQVLGTFFDLIKEESAKKPDISLDELIKMIDKMIDNEIALQVNKVVQSAQGVNFTTAHSAKGLEYDKVIIIGASKDIWDRKRGNNRSFTYPPKINGDVDSNQEDERRLMYVAMTRAERTLDISYSLQKENGGDLGASQFVDETRLASDLTISPQIVGEELVNDFQYHVLKQSIQTPALIDHDLISKRLEGYKLSVTHLNKYLKCPITFYFETILQVPMARTKYLGFGRAAHYSLEILHEDINEGKEPKKENLLTYFHKGMSHHRSHFTTQEYEDMTAFGDNALGAYYDKYIGSLNTNIKYHMEAKIDNVEYQGIPIKGVLDRVAEFKDYVEVTDYKTGNPTSQRNKPKLYAPTSRYPEGGDYWRQIVFYKILCDSDQRYGWDMTSGTMDFIEPDRKTKEFHQTTYHVSPEHIEIVGDQIKSTWQGIQNHEFEKGCGEEDCYWCNFVKNDYIGSGMPEDEELQVEDIET